MPNSETPIPAYFTSLRIENVRCFGECQQQLDLTGGDGRPARWTLILGDNGVGKTTILQCLAWMRLIPLGDDPALLAEENVILEGLLRKNAGRELSIGSNLAIGIALSSPVEGIEDAARQGSNVEITVRLLFDTRGLLSEPHYQPDPNFERVLGADFHEPLVVAYGANRQLGVRNINTGEVDDPIAASRLPRLTVLYDVGEILSDLDYAARKKDGQSREQAHLDQLLDVLARIMPEDLKAGDIQILPPDILDSGEPSGVHVPTFSGLVPITALSLGYQTTLSWTADLAWRLLKRYPESRNPLAEPAVVLIDEIDLHLHPLWQLRIIDALSALFSGTQFIATAHSPLMVQVAECANVILLRRQEMNVEIVNDPVVVRSWRVDQILASELFDVPRGRDKETARLFARRAELVDMPTRSAAEDDELERVRAQILKLPTAQDPDDQKAMDFIREAAALFKKDRPVNP